MKSFRFVLVWLGLAWAVSASGQGWQRSLNDRFLPYAIAVTPDGGSVLLTTLQDGAPEREIVLTKTDADGRVQWEILLGGPGDDTGRDLLFDPAENRLWVLGKKSTQPNNSDLWLAAVGLNGEILFQTTYSFGLLDEPCCLRRLPGGELLIALETDYQLLLLRLDQNGQQLWTQLFPQTLQETVEQLEITPDGNYLITLLRSNPPLAAPVAWVMKTDAVGAPLFSVEYQHFTSYGTTDVARCKPAPDGGYWLAHRDSLYRLDEEGLLIDAFKISAAGNFYLSDLLPIADGVVALGTEYTYNPPSSRLWLGKLTASGTFAWAHHLPIPNYAHSTWAITRHADAGFAMSGNYILDGTYRSYLIRTDSLGQIFSNQLEGDVFWDQNGDCQADGQELPMAGWIVRIGHPNGEVHYASTDSLGHFAAPAGVGAYTLQVLPSNSLWAPSCGAVTEVNFDTTFSSANIDLPVQALQDCPLPRIDAAMANWQACIDNPVVIHFANQGSAIASDAAITLQLDSLLTLSGADRPFTQTGPFTWRFELGDLAPLQSGVFTAQVFPACTGLLNGQTKCLEVTIEPLEPCANPSNGPLIEVEGFCEGDSVRFRVQNLGAPMPDALDFIVIEDNIMFLQGQFQLDAGEQTTISLPASGASWRFEGHQAGGVPGWLSDPVIAAAVEGCTVDGSFSTGFVNQFSLFDGGNFEEKECREVAPFDELPAKVAYPSGYESEHFIAANTDIEYALYFSNNGADTVLNALLRDTLDAALLSPASVEPGPGSHPYLFNLNDQGVLSFRFDSILLAPGATGWVKFRVAQQPDLPSGTVVFNRAWVGFDFAAPMPTNQVFHTITGSLLEIEDLFPAAGAEPTIRLWPVPTSQDLWIEVNTAAAYRYELFDLSGRSVLNGPFSGPLVTIPLAPYPDGIYLLRIWKEDRMLKVSKIVLHH